MSKPQAEHETLANRLSDILMQLYQGEVLAIAELADRFQVSERTLYRDLNRLGPIIDKTDDGRYTLAQTYRNRLHARDIQLFARIAGVDGLLPDNSRNFLAALLDTLSQNTLLVRGHRYEDLRPRTPEFKQLETAIRQQQQLRLQYSGKERLLKPYRLINQHGIWYLAATEAGRLKAFSFSRISQLHTLSDTFTPEPTIAKQIEQDDDIWFNPDKIEVLLNVAPHIAYYFKRRKLLPEQETVLELENGGLLVRSRASHANQILPLIRYWIPALQIVEPASLRDDLHRQLRGYVEAMAV